MITESPFFSIIVPTYNRANLIAKTLYSILAQEFSSFEVIVVDDGSSDNTEEVVSTIIDNRLKYFRKANGERGAARNFGRSIARGGYINFFDSDDLMYPNHLKVAREHIDRFDTPEFFHLGYDFQDPDGNVTKKVDNLDGAIQTTVLFDNFLSCNGVFLRADIATNFPFEEDRRLASAEDWELWIRLLSRFKISWSNVITSSVVSHDNRSIRTIAAEKVVQRDLFLIKCLKDDKEVVNYFGSSFMKFVAARFTYFMLCLAEAGQRSQVLKWSMRAFKAWPPIIFSRRFAASIKLVIR